MPGEGRQPELRHRIAAAAGASVVSAVLVNPLDVVKTRVQAASLVADRPLPSCLLTRTPTRYPVRWARSPSLADCQSRLPASTVNGCVGSPAPPGGVAAAQRMMLGQLPMSSCACALKVADLSPASLGSPEQCLSRSVPYRPMTARGVLQDIVRKEGLSALWRGTDTAIVASIPMVGVYMPLYDHLLTRLTPSLGPAYAPVAAGSLARTLAVVLVGPLELVRTRQQGSAAAAGNVWGALRETLRDTAGAAGTAAAGGSGGGGSAAAFSGALRALPRLWTGVVATLARDVPFSAIYWGLVERVRGSLLAQWQQPPQKLGEGEDELAHSGDHVRAGRQGRGHEALQQQQQQQPGTAGQGAQGGPSGRAVLLANLLAGSTAGAVAAVVTTPFDVVKTQLQLQLRTPQAPAPAPAGAAAGAGSSAINGGAPQGTLDVVRRVLQTEGPAGLFRGWGPRAARTAPACAVVVASYEVLKLLL